MASTDRRQIEGLLAKHFPQMVGKSSDDWRDFLDQETGLTTDANTPNGEAFDRWRKALAKKGYEGVWNVTPERLAEIQERSKKMLEEEQQRQTALQAATDASTGE